MSHTLIRDAGMLAAMYEFADRVLDLYSGDMAGWDLSWPLLRLWERKQITFEGITDAGWSDMEDFYEWLISEGMEPVF